MPRTKTKKKVEKKTKEKVVPFKNYIILFIICVLTLGAVVSLSLVYRRNEDKKLETPVIRGYLPEITIKDLDDYITENESFYLYIGTTKDYNSREIEQDMIDFFKKRDITKNTVYLNLRDDEVESFINSFNEKYSKQEHSKLKEYPAFIIFKDGKILDLVQRDAKVRLSIGDIDRLLDEYGL